MVSDRHSLQMALGSFVALDAYTKEGNLAQYTIFLLWVVLQAGHSIEVMGGIVLLGGSTLIARMLVLLLDPVGLLLERSYFLMGFCCF